MVSFNLAPISHSLLLMQQDVATARAEHVAKAGAQLAAAARTPADAHVGGDVLLDTHVALVVTVLADGDTFETGTGTLQVCFAAEVLLRWGACQDLGGAVRLGGRVLPCHAAHREAVEH